MPVFRSLILIVISLVLLLGSILPNEAKAHGSMGGGMAGMGEAIIMLFGAGVIELLVPDTGVEFSNGEVHADLSWPLSFTLLRVGEYDGPRAYLRALAEPHLVSGDWLSHGVYAGRVDLMPFEEDIVMYGVALEGGYVFKDGNDTPFFGAGFVLFDTFGFAGLLLSYRSTLETEKTHSITLNFEFPIPVYFLFQDLK